MKSFLVGEFHEAGPEDSVKWYSSVEKSVKAYNEVKLRDKERIVVCTNCRVVVTDLENHFAYTLVEEHSKKMGHKKGTETFWSTRDRLAILEQQFSLELAKVLIS